LIAAIIGCAPCWKEDFDRLQSLTSEFDVFAVGLDCPYIGRVDYFVTYHPKDIALYIKKRIRENLNTDFCIISHVPEKGVQVVYAYEKPSGSSSFLAAYAAVDLEYSKVILIGCPLEGQNEKKYKYEVFQKGWIAHNKDLKGRVRSMSGWTAAFLGEPDKEWIAL